MQTWKDGSIKHLCFRLTIRNVNVAKEDIAAEIYNVLD